MAKGNIIFLNGASSSGKSCIAGALQQILDEPYMHCSVDDFFDWLAKPYISQDEEDEISEEELETLTTLIPMIVSGLHHCIPALASVGINLIVDHVLQSPAWLSECVDLTAGYTVLFVGVHCPLEELERRERQRNREQGLARRQFDIVHANKLYDVEVDTSVYSSMECASQIKRALQDGPTPRAFARLRTG